MADPPGPVPAIAPRPNIMSRPASATPAPRYRPASASGTPPVGAANNNNVQSQFGRFRLQDFQASPQTQPAGQCSRFRVSDFVRYENTAGQQGVSGQTGMNGATGRPRAGSGQAGQAGQSGQGGQGGQAGQSASPHLSNAQRPGQGSFSVMHMDVEGTGPQATSSSVAATGGRGLLQKVNVQQQNRAPAKQTRRNAPAPVQQQQQQQQQQPPQQQPPQQQQLAPQPPGMQPIAPAIAPAQPVAPVPFDPSQYPEDVRWELVRVVDCIRQDQSLFVTKILAALTAAPSLADSSLLRHLSALYPPPPPPPPAPEPTPTVPVKRKRGRPPKKKDPAPEPTTSMPPPAPPPAPVPITVAPARRDKGHILTCTRCLKPFDPAWRPTPASDPSSEGTCAVPHPYTDLASGLVLSLLPQRKRNNKPTYRWRCCGREVQSSSDDLPKKEDDKTGGWCFVGRHTIEPDVRSKLGLKAGKGKEIAEVADLAGETARKRQRLENGTALPVTAPRPQIPISPSPAQPPQLPLQTNWQGLHIPQPPPQHQPIQPAPALPPAPSPHPPSPDPPVKRKRGRPKGSKTKPKPAPPATPRFSPPPPAADNSPGSQLLHEASQSHTPTLPAPPQENINAAQDYWFGASADGIGAVELGMLISATNQIPVQEPAPVKRGRGRPKGVKNGAGKAAVERKRLEEEKRREEEVQAGLGAGGGWFPGDWGDTGY